MSAALGANGPARYPLIHHSFISLHLQGVASVFWLHTCNLEAWKVPPDGRRARGLASFGGA